MDGRRRPTAASIAARAARAGAAVTGVVLLAVTPASCSGGDELGAGPGLDVAQAPRCELVLGAPAELVIAGTSLPSFRPLPEVDPGHERGCEAGTDPTLAITVSGETLGPDDAVGAPAIDGELSIERVDHPSYRIDRIRQRSPASGAENLRISDGRQVLTVAAVWTHGIGDGSAGADVLDLDEAVAVADWMLDSPSSPGSSRP